MCVCRPKIRTPFCNNCCTKFKELEQENKRLKEALRKCTPIKIDAYLELEGICPFCQIKQDFDLCEETLHRDDCEYMKLSK